MCLCENKYKNYLTNRLQNILIPKSIENAPSPRLRDSSRIRIDFKDVFPKTYPALLTITNNKTRRRIVFSGENLCHLFLQEKMKDSNINVEW